MASGNPGAVQAMVLSLQAFGVLGRKALQSQITPSSQGMAPRLQRKRRYERKSRRRRGERDLFRAKARQNHIRNQSVTSSATGTGSIARSRRFTATGPVHGCKPLRGRPVLAQVHFVRRGRLRVLAEAYFRNECFQTSDPTSAYRHIVGVVARLNPRIALETD